MQKEKVAQEMKEQVPFVGNLLVEIHAGGEDRRLRYFTDYEGKNWYLARDIAHFLLADSYNFNVSLKRTIIENEYMPVRLRKGCSPAWAITRKALESAFEKGIYSFRGDRQQDVLGILYSIEEHAQMDTTAHLRLRQDTIVALSKQLHQARSIIRQMKAEHERLMGIIEANPQIDLFNGVEDESAPKYEEAPMRLSGGMSLI